MSSLEHVDVVPNYNSMLEENIRQTIIEIQAPAETIEEVSYEEKKKMLKYMIGEAIISNWQYITLLLMVL